MKIIKLLLVLFCTIVTAKAQTVYDMIEDPDKNYYEVVKQYNAYFKTHGTGKGSGYKMFKRWEAETKYWVDEQGNRISAAHYAEELRKINASAANRTINSTASTTWIDLGPANWNSTSSWAPGLGRVEAIAIHPLNANIIYAGSPNGGCWKTANGGTTWTSLTDGLLYMKIGDVEVDSSNVNVVYIGTMGSGLLKSTNGGTTLTPMNTGLAGGINIRKIIVNPQNTSIVLLATSGGIYRSTNGGTSWTLTSNGSYYDIDFQPYNPAVVYACGTKFYKSTNGGTSFTQITNGIAVTDVMRLSVTPANPQQVCIVQCAGSVFGKFYKSTNAGTSFVTTITGNSGNGTNFFGYDPLGGDNSGQGGYNIDITTSPTDANEIHIAGIITWRSFDGGLTFVSSTEWTYPNPTGYTHCDVHALEYLGNKLFVGSDGGLSISTDLGDNFTPISAGMGIRMFYRFGSAKTNTVTIATGAQDDGGSIRTGSGWIDWIGADGMEAAVDPTNANIVYGSSQNGSFYKTTNGGTSYSNLNTPSTSGNWTTPFIIDPNVNTTLYVGYAELYKSINSGGSWTQISTLALGNLDYIEVAPSNSNYIYISSGTSIYRTTNGGTNWTNISAGLGGATINRIAVHSSSPDKVAIVTSGSQIYTSVNGGVTWTNSTGNFPAVTARCLVYQNDASEGIYVGTNTGIYYKDITMANWAPYNTGFPIVAVNELEIQYASSKIRAASYGRGVWECDLFSAVAQPPIALFGSNKTIVCPGQTVAFVDQSAGTPNAWSWAFQNGSPATSTVQNPTVTYNTPGTYSVTLIAYNSNGSDTISQTTYITVTGLTALPLVEGFASSTFPPPNWTTVNVNNDNIFWVYTSTAGSQSTPSCMMFDNYNLDAAGSKEEMQTPKYDFTGLATANLSFDVSYRQYDNQYSDTMKVLISSDCGITFTQLYSKGGSALSSVVGTQTATVFIPSGPTQWRAEAINLNTYVGQADVMIVFQNRGHYGQALYVDNINITSTTGISINNKTEQQVIIYPNPAQQDVTILFNEGALFEGTVIIESIDGKLVYEKLINTPVNKFNIDISKFARGSYFIKMKNKERLFVRKFIIE